MLDECSGTYWCETEDDGFWTYAERDDGRCYLEDVELVADGSISMPDGDDEDFSWSGDALQLAICAERGDCMTCFGEVDEDDEDDGDEDGGGRCTGSPSRCSDESPLYCSDIRGCRMQTRYGYAGHVSRDVCYGTPDSCESIGSEEACLGQGCDWE